MESNWNLIEWVLSILWTLCEAIWHSNHPIYSIYPVCVGFLSRSFLHCFPLVNFLLYFVFRIFFSYTYLYMVSDSHSSHLYLHPHSRCIHAVFTFTSSVSRWHQFVISIKNLNCKKAQEHSIPLALPFNVVAGPHTSLPLTSPFTWLRIALWPRQREEGEGGEGEGETETDASCVW